VSLAEKLHEILTHFREHVAEAVNSGPVVAIDGHLAELESVFGDAQAELEKVRKVLSELYQAPDAAPAAEPVPAGVDGEKPDAEIVPSPAEPVPADIAAEAHAAVAEAEQPATDEPQAPEAA
jgi:hypothetical protein